jgi:molybdopterin converting factor subunit 1
MPLLAIPSQGYNLNMATAASTIQVKVLFFGPLREIVGRTEDSVHLTEGSLIQALFDQYAARCPELAGYRASLMTSRNQEFAGWNSPLAAGDEVAFLPPVSGG